MTIEETRTKIWLDYQIKEIKRKIKEYERIIKIYQDTLERYNKKEEEK